jgi:hypothetical protein
MYALVPIFGLTTRVSEAVGQLNFISNGAEDVAFFNRMRILSYRSILASCDADGLSKTRKALWDQDCNITSKPSETKKVNNMAFNNYILGPSIEVRPYTPHSRCARYGMSVG